MSGEFKGTPGPWEVEDNGFFYDINAVRGTVGNTCSSANWFDNDEHRGPVALANAQLIATAPELLEALQWTLPMAIIAMEQHRMERVKNGHRDISGIYKNGESWVGIYQDEIDKIEFARAAIAKALGENL